MSKIQRKAAERGTADYSWLKSWHTFSFGRYFESDHQRFRSLRVMNEDVIQPGGGFGMHPHDNMEILTVVLSGTLEHQDSMGHGGLLRAGDVQRMSAGRGVQHSEINPSKEVPVHLYQIWLLPNERDVEPEYEQTQVRLQPEDRLSAGGSRMQLLASADGAGASMTIHADANLYFAALPAAERVRHPLTFGDHAWLQVLTGAVDILSEDTQTSLHLEAGDGLALHQEPELELAASADSRVLLFELN